MPYAGTKIIITVEDQYPSDIQFIPPAPEPKWQSKQLQDLIKRTSVVGRYLTSTPVTRNTDGRVQSARSTISSIASKAQSTATTSSRPYTARSYLSIPKESPKLLRPQSAYESTEIKRTVKPAVGLAMVHRLFEIWEPQLSKSYRKPAIQGEDDRYFRRRRKRQAKANLGLAMHFLGRSKSRSLSKASIYSNS